MPLPLLRLPEKLPVDVLRTFGIRELLAISILSKRAKNAVKLLKLRLNHAYLHIGNSIIYNISCFREDPDPTLVLEFYANLKRRNNVLNIPKNVIVASDGNEVCQWRLPSLKMTMKDWHIHIKTLFGLAYSIEFKIGFTIFNFESIKKSFTSHNILDLSIAETIPNNQSRMILKEFLPISNGLQLKRNPFLKKEDLRAILIQNLDVCYDNFPRLTDFTLDDMLMCNSEFLIICSPTWTGSDINRFLKLWRKGACPRLVKLAFLYLEEDWGWNQEEILKGISFQEVTGDREIKLFAHGEPATIRGGYDIHGKDGRICSIEVVEPSRVVFWFHSFY